MKSIAQQLSRTEVEQYGKKLESQKAEATKLLRQTEEEQKGLAADRLPELGEFCVESAAREYLFERVNHERRLHHAEKLVAHAEKLVAHAEKLVTIAIVGALALMAEIAIVIVLLWRR
jgi:hypothetical protein